MDLPIKIDNLKKFAVPGTFGDRIDLSPYLPKDCDYIYLCSKYGSGYMHIEQCLLPHQLYVSVIIKIINELWQKGYKDAEIVILPIRNKEILNLSELNVIEGI